MSKSSRLKAGQLTAADAGAEEQAQGGGVTAGDGHRNFGGQYRSPGEGAAPPPLGQVLEEGAHFAAAQVAAAGHFEAPTRHWKPATGISCVHDEGAILGHG
jgi:hypothetical protein